MNAVQSGKSVGGLVTDRSDSEAIYCDAQNNLGRLNNVQQRILSLRDRLYGGLNEPKGSGASAPRPVPVGFNSSMRAVNNDTAETIGAIESILADIERF